MSFTALKKNIVKSAMLPPDTVRRHYAEVLSRDQVLALNVLFDLRGAVNGMNNRLSRWLGSDALTPGRLQVLIVLWAAGGPIPQRDVVNALGVSRATVSDLVEALAADSLVRTSSSSNDKRQVLVELTPTGRKITALQVRRNATRLRKALRGFSDDEMADLSAMLGRLGRVLNEG